MRVLPAFVMWPRRWISLELHSGDESEVPFDLVRAPESIHSVEGRHEAHRDDVTHPGTVMRRLTTSSFREISTSRRSNDAILALRAEQGQEGGDLLEMAGQLQLSHPLRETRRLSIPNPVPLPSQET